MRQWKPKNDLGYIHVYSSLRTDEVLRISDVRFSHYHNLQHKRQIILTCAASFITCEGQTINVYGWARQPKKILHPVKMMKHLVVSSKFQSLMNLTRTKEMMNIHTVTFTRMYLYHISETKQFAHSFPTFLLPEDWKWHIYGVYILYFNLMVD